MEKSKIIRDPIHKDIKIKESEISIVDTENFQRLRNIKQTGLTCLVYPSANHTRFEHSLGTMYVAGEMAKKLDSTNVDINLIRILGLLHDIGHPPYSHTLEVNNYDHEYYTKQKIKKMDFENYQSKEVLESYNSKGLIGKLIHGEMDSDRMDYLIRDSYHTGVAYGSIDIHRIISSITDFEDSNSLGILEKGVSAIESLLIARYQMYPTVYMHPVSRIAECMLKNATLDILKDGTIENKDLSIMDDIDLVSTLRNSEGYGKELMKMLDTRNLFKNIATFPYRELKPLEIYKLINLTESNLAVLEELLYDKMGFKLYLDIPKPPKIVENKVPVLINGKKHRLDEVSPLVQNLKVAYKKSWNVRVYAEPNNISNENIQNQKYNIKNSPYELKNIIYDLIDEYELVNESELFDNNSIINILSENSVVKGYSTFMAYAKNKGLSEAILSSELQKLLFSGMVKKRTVQMGGIYRYDYKLVDESIISR
ncbi:HD superfamily phosphohydrolase [Methanococcus voltae]|uniref:HD domain-containing protein n=1 Tax=Methanococcus voltae TaxID=2188 RepID=UPI001AE77E88|nr:HD domain-containing protein [Methanococcus voltae]MBP2144338.1 HD superfamily phosphohydrolase [Methanococcus voltae]